MKVFKQLFPMYIISQFHLCLVGGWGHQQLVSSVCMFIRYKQFIKHTASTVVYNSHHHNNNTIRWCIGWKIRKISKNILLTLQWIKLRLEIDKATKWHFSIPLLLWYYWIYESNKAKNILEFWTKLFQYLVLKVVWCVI